MKRIVCYKSQEEFPSLQAAEEVGTHIKDSMLAMLDSEGIPTSALDSTVYMRKIGEGRWIYIIALDYPGPGKKFLKYAIPRKLPSAKPKAEFLFGDVVQLKPFSGSVFVPTKLLGVSLTIEDLKYSTHYKAKAALCIWYDGREYQRQWFPTTMLKHK